MDSPWTLVDAVSVAPQAAFTTYRHGAAQPVEGNVTECVGLRVVSFNLGIPQTMMDSCRQWNKKHIFTFRDVLNGLGVAGNDFVFCSEVGDVRKGFKAANVDCRNLVAEALAGADCSTSGAYLHIWNVEKQAAAVVASGTWPVAGAHSVDVYWQAFDLTYRDASQVADRDVIQLAAPKVGLLVGNLHIPVGRTYAPSHQTRRRIVTSALQHLTGLQVDGWRDRQDFPVMRLLVGDCNLDKQGAEAATQQNHTPLITALQRDLNLSHWQVCDGHFPGQALESARTQTSKK